MDGNIAQEDGDLLIFKCPHCNEDIEVLRNEINCHIFRHGIFKADYQQMNPHEINDILLVLLKIDHLCKNHNYNWSDLAKRGSISNLSHLDTNQILQVLKKWYEFLIDQILFRDFNEKIEPTWSIRHNTR